MADASLRTALITGANRGIGRAIADGLAAHGGFRVLAAARQESDAQATARAIADAATGADVVGVQLDLADPAAAADRARAIEIDHGPIDVLINNAGVLVRADGLGVSLADVTDSLAVNAVAPLALIQALAPGMQQRGYGRIVNVSSGWGSFGEGLEGPAAYAISKAALNAVTLSLAHTLGNAVKVNATCPGWVRTRMGGQEAARSPAQGADTPIWLATLPDDGPTGGFFRDRRPIPW
ncbi:MAG: SDR family NAD(P)-dependent oxidoreductase [Acidobacteriota bacterium]